MYAIFKDSEVEQQFQRDGFVIASFFDLNEVARLRSIYTSLPQGNEFLFESTSFLDDMNLKKDADREVNSVFNEKVESFFKNHKILGSSFLTKKPGTASVMPIHQDWTVVDESKFYSLTCWIPLQDTNLQNGSMQVIKGSHRLSNALRSPSLPVSFEHIASELYPFLETIQLKAGEGIIFNQSLMHASLPNKSKENRLAVTLGLTHQDAQLQMYYQKEGMTERWMMPDDMFLNYPKIRFEPLIGELHETFSYEVPELKLETVLNHQMTLRKQYKMKPLFKSEENQQLFEKNGFIKLPALDQEDISALTELYKTLNLNDEKGYGFHVGMDNPDKTLVSKMVEQISAVALPKLSGHLSETQLFTASFVVKEPNPTGVVPPHQDWSFVENETDYCSVTCWIPLVDVNIDNGCIGIIKGSNHFFGSVRPSPSPQVETPLKDHMYTIFPFLELLEMKAGEALIFNNKTIHASPPNTTDSTRLAIGLGFTQREASICHYYLKPGTTDVLLKYKIDKEFFLKYDNAQLSRMFDKGELIQGYGVPEEVPYSFESLSAEAFSTRIAESCNVYNPVLVAKMSKLFTNHTASGPEEEKPTHISEQVAEVVKPFWKVYTPLNIFREVILRVKGKQNV